MAPWRFTGWLCGGVVFCDFFATIAEGQMSQQEEPLFSLAHYYRGSRLARIIDVFLVLLVALLLLFAPLPFGSVEEDARVILESTSALCFLLWMIKLIYGGNREQLHFFRQRHKKENEILRERPFFYRHYRIAKLIHILTLGIFPRKHTAANLVADQNPDEELLHPRRFFSFLGFPVRNTGIEGIAILFLLLLCIQLAPLPSALVHALSPSTYDLYDSASRATGQSYSFIPLSLDPFATFTKLLEYLAYFAMFLVIVNNFRTRTLFWILLYTLFLSAVFQGLYGLYEFLSGSHHIFAYERKAGWDSASGTFINRNHFAAYLEMSLPLLVALIVGRVHQLRSFRGNIFLRIAHALETEGSQILMLLFMIVLVAVALIFSLSRSGISFALAALVVFLFLYWRAQRRLSRKAYLVLGLCGTVALTVWIGLNPVLHRFVHVSENWAEGARLQVWSDTFRIFAHFPLAGTGGGTFPQIFPMYRSFIYNNVYREAHNDYVQLLAESGIVFVALLLLLGDVLFGRLRQILSREMRRLEIIQLGCFCSLLSVALHSLTDFSLQIPAIALQTGVIAGLLFSHYHAEHRNNR